MSDNVQQTYSIDATQALSALAQLDAGYNKLSESLLNTASAISRFNSVGAAVDKVGSSFKSSFSQASAASGQLNSDIGKLTTSFELLARISFTQAIVSGIGKIKREFSEAIDAAVEFQTKIEDIQTISGGQLGSSPQIAKQVKAVSDAFNTPLTEATSGLYQTVSAGIGKGAENIEFLGKAAQFAKASLTPLDQSVLLLSGALNSYGKTAADTDEISSKFSKTIEVGAVRGTDLAASFGRVAPLAANLGVSIEEVDAAFASQTVRGIKAAEAGTALRGVLIGLVKPTDAMRDALGNLGYSSAEQGIATQGLGGLLGSLAKQTDGTTAGLAKLFQNQRGIIGVLNIGTLGADKYQEKLREIASASNDLTSVRAGQILATDAQKFEGQANKLKNAFTTGFGESLLHTVVGASNLVGGVDTITSSVSTLAPVLETGAALLAAYGAKALFASAQSRLFGQSLGAIPRTALLVGSAVAIGNALGNALSAKSTDHGDSDQLTAFKSASAATLAAARATDNARVQSALQATSAISKSYNDQVQAAQTADSALGKSVQKSVNEILKTREKLAEATERAAEHARDLSASSKERVTDLGDLKANRAFDAQIKGRSEITQSLALGERANSLAAKASALLKTGAASGNQSTINRALGLFNQAQQAGERASDIADKTGNRALSNRAADALLAVTNKQIASEKILQGLSDKRAADLDKSAEGQRRVNDDIKAAGKLLTENLSPLDDQGKLLTGDAAKKQNANRAKALQTILNSAFNSKDIDLSQSLGLTQLAANLQKEPIALQFEVEGGVKSIQDKLTAAFSDFKLKTGFGSPDELLSGTSNAKKQADALRTGFSSLTANKAKIGELQGSIGEALAATQTTGRGVQRGIGGQSSAVPLDQIADVRSSIAQTAKSPAITDDQLQGILGKLGNVAKYADSGAFSNVGVSNDVGNFADALSQLKQIQELQKQNASNPASAPGADQQLGALDRAMQGFEGVSQVTERLSLSLSSLANAIQATSEKLTAGSFSGGAEKHALGGQIGRFAGGGQYTDTINAQLSKGEYVVNANSAGKWYSQLQSINAGQRPNVPNTVDNSFHVGDINVTGGASNSGTASAVLDALKRAQRRGTGRSLN